MNSPGRTFRAAVPAQRLGRHQVPLVYADVSNDCEGLCFEAGTQGMSDGGRGKDVGRAKRLERRSFGGSSPSRGVIRKGTGC